MNSVPDRSNHPGRRIKVRDKLDAADLPLLATPGDEEDRDAIGKDLWKSVDNRDFHALTQSLTNDAPADTTENPLNQAQTDVEFNLIRLGNSDWAEKDRALGDALQKHFANHPHPEVQKLLAQHRRGLMGGHELHQFLGKIED